MPDTPAYFERTGPARFRATERTGGAWSVSEQHVSPLNGLLVHAVDRSVAERHLSLGVAAEGVRRLLEGRGWLP